MLKRTDTLEKFINLNNEKQEVYELAKIRATENSASDYACDYEPTMEEIVEQCISIYECPELHIDIIENWIDAVWNQSIYDNRSFINRYYLLKNRNMDYINSCIETKEELKQHEAYLEKYLENY